MGLADNLVGVCQQMRIRGLASLAVMFLAGVLYYYLKLHGGKYEKYKKAAELLFILGLLGAIFIWVFGIFSPITGFDSDAGAITVDTLTCTPYCENGC